MDGSMEKAAIHRSFKELANKPVTNLSIVVPVYNEALCLRQLCNELWSVLRDIGFSYEIIFIDDGSGDESIDVLRELHDTDSNVKIIRFRRNFGQTAAFAAGFRYASGDLVITLDADGQNDPADIHHLMEKLFEGEYDLVVGWRIDRKESLLRRVVSRVANLIISRTTGIIIHDRGCSLKVFRSEIVKHLRLYSQLHRYLPEMAHAIGARIAEVPVNDRDRRFGKPKYGSLSRTPRVILDLITITFLLSFFSSPMRLFGSIGLISTLTGLIVSGSMALAKVYYGIAKGWGGFHAYEIGGRPLFLFALLAILIGVQLVLMGFIGEMIMRTYHEVQDKPIYSIREIIE